MLSLGHAHVLYACSVLAAFEPPLFSTPCVCRWLSYAVGPPLLSLDNAELTVLPDVSAAQLTCSVGSACELGESHICATRVTVTPLARGLWLEVTST